MRALRIAAVFLLLSGVAAGCRGGSGFGNVSGTVAYDGKPVEQGSISFVPVDGKGPTAGGMIANGKYAVEKVPVGAAKVSISGVRVTGTKKLYEDDPESPVVQTATELLPPKYNQSSELQYEVKAGPQTKNFDLPR